MNARVSSDTAALVRRGLLLEYLTITWSVLAPAVATVAGIVLTASALAVMALLGIAKKRTGARFGNAVLMAEARVILIDAGLAATLLVGLLLNAALGWWADPLGLAALAVNEGQEAVRSE